MRNIYYDEVFCTLFIRVLLVFSLLLILFICFLFTSVFSQLDLYFMFIFIRNIIIYFYACLFLLYSLFFLGLTFSYYVKWDDYTQ